MTANNIKAARILLKLNQTDFAKLLGWTSKRNIVNLERGDKEAMTQTALAIECLLRRNNKFGDYEMLVEIKARLEQQKQELIKNKDSLSNADLKNLIFSEDDVVEQYLSENKISEDDVNLEELRDLQHTLLLELEN